MRVSGPFLWLIVGLVLGGAFAWLIVGQQAPVRADSDHNGEYILCTGAISASFRTTAVRVLPAQKIRHVEREPVPIDGIWLLDYGAGKLLATVLDRLTGKITGWAELDLIPEFDLASGQIVHFTMTSGNVDSGQAALYLAETNTGKIGVYTMAAAGNGVQIERHERTEFRVAAPK